jgi:hypothetical protein
VREAALADEVSGYLLTLDVTGTTVTVVAIRLLVSLSPGVV